MKIGLGSDHGGFELKRKIKELLAQRPEFEVTDFGTYSPESVDYPDFAVKWPAAFQKVRSTKAS